MRVAVIGAGIAGSSAARYLAKRGHQTVLFEQFKLAHRQGSSHGASRIIRKAYPDPFFTAIMAEAYPLWEDIENECSTRLRHEVGLLYFGSKNAPNMVEMEEGLRSLDIPYQIYSPGDFPAIKMQSGEIGLFTPEAGWVNATEAVKASLSLAAQDGTETRHEKVTDLERIQKDFDAVVIAAGSWTTDFVDTDVSVSVQTIAYLEGIHHEGPVWIEDGPNVYGFPTEPQGQGIKVALHEVGPKLINRQDDRVPLIPPQVTAFAQNRLGIESPVFSRAETCLYTNTPNEDFRWGKLSDNTFWVTACSGHGFKFGPWIGRKMADFVEAKDKPESYPRFVQR